MRILSVIGRTKTDRTITVENIIKELKRRRYTVGSMKGIGHEEIGADIGGINMDRHKKAGSQLISVRGICGAGILLQGEISMDKLLRFYDHDFVILEGIIDANAPRIIVADDAGGIEEKYDKLTFCISGMVSDTETEYKGLPVINSTDNIEKLVDLIEEKVYKRLPDFPPECCRACGFNCRELGSKILKGEAVREDCKILNTKVELLVDNNKIQIVPFVEDILSNAVLGVVKELEGYKKGKEIKVIIDGEFEKPCS